MTVKRKGSDNDIEKKDTCPYCEEQILGFKLPYCKPCEVKLRYCAKCGVSVIRDSACCPTCGGELVWK